MSNRTKEIQHAIEVLGPGVAADKVVEHILVIRTADGEVLASSNLSPGNWPQLLSDMQGVLKRS